MLQPSAGEAAAAPANPRAPWRWGKHSGLMWNDMEGLVPAVRSRAPQVRCTAGQSTRTCAEPSPGRKLPAFSRAPGSRVRDLSH
eukprot:scaffold8422_cov115-Isochrysis_galbana.AAC.1